MATSRATRTSAGSKDKEDKCPSCDKIVTQKDTAVQCEICECWWHAKCEAISEEGFKVLQRENAHWFCVKCNKGAGKVLQALAKVEARLDKTDEEVKGVKQRVDTLSIEVEDIIGRLNEHNRDVNNLVVRIEELESKESDEQEVAGTIDDVIDRSVNVRLIQLEQLKESLTETKASVEEQKDKEDRMNNIIIYRVAESHAENVTDRGIEDRRFVEQLLCGLNVGVVHEDIRKVLRLGKRMVDTDPQRGPRPLLVQLGSRMIKNLVMESLYKIKSMESKFRSVIVAHDMTKLEREACKALVEEARRRTQNETGEWVHRVRGPPGKMHIVRIRNRHQ